MRVNKAERDGFATDSILAAYNPVSFIRKSSPLIPIMTPNMAQSATNLRICGRNTTNWPQVWRPEISPMFAVKAEPAILEASRKPRDENRSFCLRACSRS